MTDKEKLDILIEGLIKIINEAQRSANDGNARFAKERRWQDETTLEGIGARAYQDGLWASRMRGLLSKVAPIKTEVGD